MVPMPVDNIDTDQIIPARFLKTISKVGLGDQLFYDWRYDADGKPEAGFRPEQAGGESAPDSARGRQLRLRQFARACAVGADAVRLSRGDQHLVRRYLSSTIR